MTDEIRKLLENAKRSPCSRDAAKGGDAEFAAGRAYYAMLHTAQALLRERGFRYRRHAGVHTAFGEHFAKAGLLDAKYHRWLLDAFDERLRGDYDFEVSLDTRHVGMRIEQAKEFIEVATNLLRRMG